MKERVDERKEEERKRWKERGESVREEGTIGSD